jgi:hypothetical protein
MTTTWLILSLVKPFFAYSSQAELPKMRLSHNRLVNQRSTQDKALSLV